jgi:hypothetical protein
MSFTFFARSQQAVSATFIQNSDQAVENFHENVIYFRQNIFHLTTNKQSFEEKLLKWLTWTWQTEIYLEL